MTDERLKAANCPKARASMILMLEQNFQRIRCLGCNIFFQKEKVETESGVKGVVIDMSMDCEGPPSKAPEN